MARSCVPACLTGWLTSFVFAVDRTVFCTFLVVLEAAGRVHTRSLRAEHTRPGTELAA